MHAVLSATAGNTHHPGLSYVRIAFANDIDQKTYGSAQVVAASACFAGFVVQTVFDEEWKNVRRAFAVHFPRK